MTPVERLGECGVSTKNVASESASATIFGDLGVGCFACSLYASIWCN